MSIISPLLIKYWIAEVPIIFNLSGINFIFFDSINFFYIAPLLEKKKASSNWAS